MKYQFEGLQNGDRVVVTNHYKGDTLVGKLGLLIEGVDIDVAQQELWHDNGDWTLLESGPDAMAICQFESIKKVEE